MPLTQGLYTESSPFTPHCVSWWFEAFVWWGACGAHNFCLLSSRGHAVMCGQKSATHKVNVFVDACGWTRWKQIWLKKATICLCYISLATPNEQNGCRRPVVWWAGLPVGHMVFQARSFPSGFTRGGGRMCVCCELLLSVHFIMELLFSHLTEWWCTCA